MFFDEGQYQRAAVRYHHAITYFEYAIPDDDEQQGERGRGSSTSVHQLCRAACSSELSVARGL